MLSRFLVTLRLLATHGCLAFGSVGGGGGAGPTPPPHAHSPRPPDGAGAGRGPRRFPAAGLLFSLRSKLPYAPALALLYTQFALLELFP